MKIYDFLSRIGLVKKSYASKFFLVASPLILIAITELAIIIAISPDMTMAFRIVVLCLFALTMITIFAMVRSFRRLMDPLALANEALKKYIASKELPDLPVKYEDEAGEIMKNIQGTISQLNVLLVEKSDMIDLLSHDLRSPVGRILNLSNLVKHDSDDKDLYADYITNECKGLLRMLENILLMLKEDSHAFHVMNVNLKDLIEETAGFFDFSLAEKNLTMAIDIDEHVVIHAQKDLFTQAVRNIIGNAIKFSPDGKTISIVATEEKEHVTLCIKDEGLGFKPTDIVKIFDRFTAVGKKGTRGESSTGLGLYLSKKIIEKHGGKLRADSAGTNKGASFTIILNRLITKKPQDKSSKRAPEELAA